MELNESEIKNNLMKVLLEEYRRRTVEISKRIGFAENINHFYILLIAASIAAFTQILLSQKHEKDIIMAFFLLISPYPFYFLTLIALNHLFMVISNTRYINLVLRPLLLDNLKEEGILLWESFLADERKWRKCNMPKLLMYGHEYLLPLFIPSLSNVGAAIFLFSYNVTYSLLPHNLLFLSKLIYLANIALYFYIIYSRIKVNKAFERILKQ